MIRRAGPAGRTAKRRAVAGDRGATLVIVLVMVTVLSVASLSVAKFSFGSAKAEDAYGQNQRLSDALDVAAAGALDDVRAAGNACPTATSNPPWPLTVQDVDGLARQPNNLVPVSVQLDCTGTGNQLLLTATRMVTCPSGAVAATTRLTLTLLRTTVGESSVPSLQVQQRNVTDLTGCAST